jgi:hypothetical protein
MKILSAWNISQFGQSQCVMDMASHAINTLETPQESKTRNDANSAERLEVESQGHRLRDPKEIVQYDRHKENTQQ